MEEEGKDESMEAEKPLKPLPLHKRTYTGKLLDVGQVAKILRVHPATVRSWIKKGKMPALRTPGGTFKIYGSTVDDLLKEYQPDDE